jgi:uncharacterized membrane protein YdjX (TVP38/TMEM64 family)
LKKLFTVPVLSSIFLTILPILFSSVITFLAIENEKTILQFTATQWILLTILCTFTSIIAVSPPTFLAVVFGYFLGWKSLPMLLVLNIGAIFLVNRVVVLFKDKFDFMNNFLAQNQQVSGLLNAIKQDEFRIIFFTKLSPIMPFALTNLVFSLSGARLKNILWGGFLGMIPRTLLAIWSSMQVRNIRKLLENPNENSTNQIILIVLFVVSIIGLYAVVQKITLRSKDK